MSHGWGLSERVDAYNWQIGANHIPLLYFDVYNLLFKLENALRMVVFVALKSSKGKDWLNAPIPTRDPKPPDREEATARVPEPTIRMVANQRMQGLRAYSYLGERTSIPMMYLDFEQLVAILSDERNRASFNSILDGNVLTFANKLEEVRVIRNNLAHFRKVTVRDFHRLAGAVADIQPYIDRFLHELTEDDAGNYRDDLSGIDGLLAKASVDLGGADTVSLAFARTEGWLRVTLIQYVRGCDVHVDDDVNATFYAVEPRQVWGEPGKKDAQGAVIFYRAAGGLNMVKPSNVGDGWCPGHVGLNFYVRWLVDGQRLDERLQRFYECLMAVALDVAGQQARSQCETPTILRRHRIPVQDTDDGKQVPYDPFVTQDKDIPEDWTGTDAFMSLQSCRRFPWLDEDISSADEEFKKLVQEFYHAKVVPGA